MNSEDRLLTDALRTAIKGLQDEQSRAPNGQFGSGGSTGSGSKVAQAHAKNKAAGLTQPSLKEREAKESAERHKAKTQTVMTKEQTQAAQKQHLAKVRAERLANERRS